MDHYCFRVGEEGRNPVLSRYILYSGPSLRKVQQVTEPRRACHL